MRPEELKMLLHSLLSNWEDEVVEFKRGGAGFSTGEIGEYFSALANSLGRARHAPKYGGSEIQGTYGAGSVAQLHRASGLFAECPSDGDGICRSARAREPRFVL